MGTIDISYETYYRVWLNEWYSNVISMPAKFKTGIGKVHIDSCTENVSQLFLI